MDEWMNHALVYLGAYEVNYAALKTGATTYLSSAKESVPIASPSVDGIVVGYMERAGKKFAAVRVRFEYQDVVIRNPILLHQPRHLGGRRFSASPVVISDELVSSLMDDLLMANPAQEPELALLLNRVNQVRRGDRQSID
jgi:hypothetical protein